MSLNVFWWAGSSIEVVMVSFREMSPVPCLRAKKCNARTIAQSKTQRHWAEANETSVVHARCKNWLNESLRNFFFM